MLFLGLVVLIAFCRLADRIWHSRYGISDGAVPASLHEVLTLQRSRLNNVTPTLLVISIWIEIFLLIAALGPRPAYWIPLTILVGLRCRHLQEVTHFAVHGVLAKNRRVGDFLATASFQAILIMADVDSRRRSHVREHHPNATVLGRDPNLNSLALAGLRPGWQYSEFLWMIIFPLTWSGIKVTLSDLSHNFRSQAGWKLSIWILLPSCFISLSFLLAGWSGIVFGCLIPRLLAYPLFSWFSLIVEHRWFNRAKPTGVVLTDEASRCLRLYTDRPLRKTLSRLTLLPYGDAFHFAHSVHPAIRWNYLDLVDEILNAEVKEFSRLILGSDSALMNLFNEGVREDASAPRK